MSKEQRIQQIIKEHQERLNSDAKNAIVSNSEIIESFTAVNGGTQGHLLNILYLHHQVHANVIRALMKCGAPDEVRQSINSMWVDSMSSVATRLSKITKVDQAQVLRIITTAQGMTDRLVHIMDKTEADIAAQIKREFLE